MYSRRSLLTGAALTAGGLLLPRRLAIAATPPNWGADPFTLGVASGEPRPTSVLLWTRLAPDPLADDPKTPGGMSGDSLPLQYEVATDENMRHVVRRGTAIADATYAYSVHQQVNGLAPGRPYWFRFHAGSASSPIGRAMTAPALAARPTKLHFTYFSCSNYEHGYFSAYRHAAEEHPDFGIYLGDFIYEYIETRIPVPRHHSDGVECKTLTGYRNRYAQYRTDADLKKVSATMPSIVTWDDHEVQNDYADKWAQDFTDPLTFLSRRAAAYQAFYEHMPVSREPNGSAMQVYDRFDFGDLLHVDLIDGRQHRSPEACYSKPDKGHGHQETATCPELADPSRSMIGMEQEAWLFDGLATSKARWNIIANDTMMAQFKEKNPAGETAFWTDDWNGYPASRARLLQHIADSKVKNPIVITGDIHSFWANDLKRDFNDPSSPTIGTELIGTSVTSPGPPQDLFEKFLPDNPHIKFFESRKRGYVSVNLTPKHLTARYQTVSDIADPKATLSTLATFAVENGKPGAQKV